MFLYYGNIKNEENRNDTMASVGSHNVEYDGVFR